MLLAFTRDTTFSVWEYEEALRHFEGVDVEAGEYMFYSDRGEWLEPVFTAPNRRGRFLGISWVESGFYRLEARPDAERQPLWYSLQESPTCSDLGRFATVEELFDLLRSRGAQVEPPAGWTPPNAWSAPG